LHFDLLFS